MFALNSNNINVLIGLLVPGVFLGLSMPSASGSLTAGSYACLTVVTLLLAYLGRGIRRWAGWVIMAGYSFFVLLLLMVS